MSPRNPQYLIGLIGDPVGHSLSPALFEVLLRELRFSGRWSYRACRLSADRLPRFLHKDTRRKLLGFNVTIPHKERIIPLLDGLSDEAERIGAVNTVVNERGRWVGHNTDCTGFMRVLRHHAIDPAAQRVVLLGAGGAARAVLFGLLNAGCRELTLCNRDRSRAEQLAAAFGGKVHVVRWPGDAHDVGALDEAIRAGSLLVNATPVGMGPHADDSALPDRTALHDGMFVFDLVYNPLHTRLLCDARTAGARGTNGLEMLVYQAAESLKLWMAQVGVKSELEIDRVLPAVTAALQRHQTMVHLKGVP